MPINIERTKTGYPIWHEADIKAFPNQKQHGNFTYSDCPICGHPKFWIDDNGFIGCWHCNNQTDLFHGPNGKRVQVIERWAPSQEDDGAKPRRSRHRNIRRAPAYAVPVTPKEAAPAPDKQAKVIDLLNMCQPIEGTPGMSYLIEHRALTKEAVDALDAMYIKHWTGWQRVVFPFRNEAGDIVGLNARAFDLNGAEIPKADKWRSCGSREIITTPNALQAHSVAICEAALDAVSLWMAGLPAFAVGGCDKIPAWLIKHLNAGITHGKTTVWIASDTDDAGKLFKTKQAIQALNLCNVYELKPPDMPGVKDWNDVLVKHGLDELRAQVQAVTGQTVNTTAAAPASMTSHEHNQKYGWTQYYSHALEREVIIKRDARTRIPSNVTGQVWTRAQVDQTAGMSNEGVKFLSDVIAVFDGELMPADASDGDLFTDA